MKIFTRINIRSVLVVLYVRVSLQCVNIIILKVLFIVYFVYFVLECEVFTGASKTTSTSATKTALDNSGKYKGAHWFRPSAVILKHHK